MVAKKRSQPSGTKTKPPKLPPSRPMPPHKPPRVKDPLKKGVPAGGHRPKRKR